jgi:hypothetical protein
MLAKRLANPRRSLEVFVPETRQIMRAITAPVRIVHRHDNNLPAARLFKGKSLWKAATVAT